MSITLHLPPEVEAGLLAEAKARGVPVDNLLEEVIRRFAERDTPIESPRATGRLVQESGVWVLSTGQPIGPEVVQDTLDAIRQERDLGNLGQLL
jgi:hypothetical protein